MQRDVRVRTDWPSRDIQTVALQQQARDWWNVERPKIDIVTSQLTPDEASRGDPATASDRMKLLIGIPLLDIDADAQALAGLVLLAVAEPRYEFRRTVIA